MAGKNRWRKVVTAISFVGLVVMALNIERLAEFFGLDATLVSVAQYVPIQVQRVWDLFTSPAVLAASVVVVAYTAGLWTEAYFRHRARRKSIPFDYERFAAECEKVSRILEANAEFYDGIAQHTTGISWYFQDIERVLKKQLGVKIKLEPQNKASALDVAQFLNDASVQIRRENFGNLRDMIQTYNINYRALKNTLSSPNASQPEPSVPLYMQER
jgi:hypothetical protein